MQEAKLRSLESNPYLPPHRTSRFEPLRKDDDPKSTQQHEEVKLELKPLPSNLRYAFLDSNSKFPFIVNSSLHNNYVDALCEVLLSHRDAIGYFINDLKGHSLNVYIYRILLEDGVKPSIKGQRRLNPTLKEVVIKEVIKLLDNGIIYSISDSK